MYLYSYAFIICVSFYTYLIHTYIYIHFQSLGMTLSGLPQAAQRSPAGGLKPLSGSLGVENMGEFSQQKMWFHGPWDSMVISWYQRLLSWDLTMFNRVQYGI